MACFVLLEPLASTASTPASSSVAAPCAVAVSGFDFLFLALFNADICAASLQGFEQVDPFLALHLQLPQRIVKRPLGFGLGGVIRGEIIGLVVVNLV
jgi:hypothetical protein